MKSELKITRLSEIDITSPVAIAKLQACEGSYRRGVTHGLEVAWRLLPSNGILSRYRKDLAEACDVAMEFRLNKNSGSLALTDDILQKVKERRVL
ncbi:MAG: hypothetical protein Q7T18_02145 [Sedimentisphaerales bacterium]|nr:hypothetical protein [Sedimentisphaerales bacterium]